MIYKNYTPHKVVVFTTTVGLKFNQRTRCYEFEEGYGVDNVSHVVFESDGVARCSVEQTEVGNDNGITIVSSHFGELEGLPEPEADTKYIVSAVAASAARALGRTDVVTVMGTVRDPNTGVVFGCTALSIG